MRLPAAILVSPAPVDGYPPVQHQARMLADEGFAVELITVPLSWVGGDVRFAYPGVSVRTQPARGFGTVNAARRLADFTVSVTAARRRHAGSQFIEIAYEPMGMLYSDLAPMRPRLRIAHFHESLARLETAWRERRLRKSIRNYQAVVVPDSDRAKILKEQLALTSSPIVVPNYPMRETRQKIPAAGKRANGSFEIVYCGALGMTQKLDLVIESLTACPDSIVFTMLGNDRSEIAERLKCLASDRRVKERVRFEGWVPYDQLSRRLARYDLGILLLDSSYEQFRTALGASNKRYQYMQAGLPQIGDMNPGISDLLEGQGIGRCLKSFSATELAGIVTDYAKNPEKCAAEGERAYRLHLEKYNYQTAFKPVLEWISSELGQSLI